MLPIVKQAWRQLVWSMSKEQLRARFLGEDGRQIQQRLDTHQLYLFTSYYRLRLQGEVSEAAVEKLTREAGAAGFIKQAEEVQQSLIQQVLQMSTALHTSLQHLGDPAAAAAAFQSPPSLLEEEIPPVEPATPSSGLAYAGMLSKAQMDRQRAAAARSESSVGIADVASASGRELGFRLGVRRSEVQHQEAGYGLFVEEGRVLPGQVVALFPGVVYPKGTHPSIPNYPKVDKDNPYLIARYDISITDSKPWGRGQIGLTANRATGSQILDHRRQPAASAGPGGSGSWAHINSAAVGSWITLTSAAAQNLHILEARNPYALAHYANHPGRGMKHNTMVAPYTIPAFEVPGESSQETPNLLNSDPTSLAESPPASLRAYLPNVLYAEQQLSHVEVLEQEVGAVALVAIDSIEEGQEVLFNYRLSPGLGRPKWYVPVNESEERRRWA